MRPAIMLAVFAAFATSSTASAGEAEKLKCKTAFFGGGNSAEYACNGDYTFRYRGGVDRGTYKISGNRVCVSFTSGASRCDTILPGNVLQNEKGRKYNFQLQ